MTDTIETGKGVNPGVTTATADKKAGLNAIQPDVKVVAKKIEDAFQQAKEIGVEGGYLAIGGAIGIPAWVKAYGEDAEIFNMKLVSAPTLIERDIKTGNFAGKKLVVVNAKFRVKRVIPAAMNQPKQEVESDVTAQLTEDTLARIVATGDEGTFTGTVTRRERTILQDNGEEKTQVIWGLTV